MNSIAFSPTIPAGSAQRILSGSATERAEMIVQRCGGGRQSNKGWRVCCPAHDDSSPSLVITAAGERVLLNCFGGCCVEAVLAAIGLSIHDLFADDLPSSPRRKSPAPLGPRIPEPPGGPTPQNVALQIVLELIIDDCGLLDIEPCQALFREAATDPLTRLWIEQQLWRHHLDPDVVWRIAKVPASATPFGLRTFRVTHTQGASACQDR